MSEIKKRVGVVGGGAIAQNSHIPGYAANPAFELAAIADPCDASLAQVREQWAFGKEYHDYKEMLKAEKLDVVSVCTPNRFHAEIAIAALEAGADVVLEKPIALCIEDGLAIKAAAERTGHRVFTCFSHRFSALNIPARDAIKEGVIGKPYMIRVRFAHMGPWPGWAKTDWFYNPEMSGGGATLDMAVHAYDLVRFLIGDVTAVMSKAATLRKDIKVDDNVVTILEIGNSCMGYVEAGWTSCAGFGGVEIMGDNGYMVAELGKENVVVIHGVVKPDGTNETVTENIPCLSTGSHWKYQMECITRSILTNEPGCPTIDDGIKALKVTLAAYESSRTGKRIEIK